MNLRTARKMRRFSQQELADRVGLTFATISNYESGKTSPGLEIRRRIEFVLNTMIDWPIVHSDAVLTVNEECKLNGCINMAAQAFGFKNAWNLFRKLSNREAREFLANMDQGQSDVLPHTGCKLEG